MKYDKTLLDCLSSDKVRSNWDLPCPACHKPYVERRTTFSHRATQWSRVYGCASCGFRLTVRVGRPHEEATTIEAKMYETIITQKETKNV